MPATAKGQTAKRPARSATTAVESQSGVARRERNCSVARTLDIVSDAWAFLIIARRSSGRKRSRLPFGAGPRATLTIGC